MRGPNRESLIWTPWLWHQLRRPNWPHPRDRPEGRGMTRRADRYFVQQQLGEMNLKESAFAQRCTLLGAQPESPEREQFDSAREDAKEDGKTASALDAELDASTGEKTDASGCPARTPSAEWRCRRNCAMHRECTRAQREFRRPKNRRLSFPLFRETTKEDAISYRDLRKVRLKTPWNTATMPPRWRKQCLHPWMVWPETMPRW